MLDFELLPLQSHKVTCPKCVVRYQVRGKATRFCYPSRDQSLEERVANEKVINQFTIMRTFVILSDVLSLFGQALQCEMDLVKISDLQEPNRPVGHYRTTVSLQGKGQLRKTATFDCH